MPVQVQSFFHRDSNTFSYLVSDPASGEAALIDPVLDYDPDTDASSESPLRAALQAIEQQGLQLRWLLETHAHADHVSAGRRLKQRFPQATLAIGEGIRAVQATFAPRYGLQLPGADEIFDHLFSDGETFALGELRCQVIAVPGHTSDSIAYLIDDALFTGDSLFMPDGGTARCDFPAVMPHSCTARSSACWPCPMPPACSSATTTARAAATSPTKPPSANSARTTSTCTTAWPRRSSSACARPAMRRWKNRS
jgi:glyoxylase-like metal-dependent hydrolase (beta-lactamase superfamily II)